MKLIDLLSVIDEYELVEVRDVEGNEIGHYNGKDSIPEEIDDADVVKVETGESTLGDFLAIVITVD